MSQHTPGPWKAGKSCDGFLTVTDGTKTICTIGETDIFPAIESDAEFIVRACNSHDALLAALKAIERAACAGYNTTAKQEALRLILDTVKPVIAGIDGGGHEASK